MESRAPANADRSFVVIGQQIMLQTWSYGCWLGKFHSPNGIKFREEYMRQNISTQEPSASERFLSHNSCSPEKLSAHAKAVPRQSVKL